MAKKTKRRPRQAAARSTSGFTFETERDGLVAAFTAGEGSEWDIGEHWANLVRHHLWKKAGYTSATEFIGGELEARGFDVPRPGTLSRWAKVAKTFTRPVTLRVGITRLVRALAYWRSRGKTDFSRSDPGSELIEVPLEGGGVQQKPLQSCTEEELEAAATGGSPGRSGPALSAEDAAVQTEMQSALAQALDGGGQATVRLKRKSGELYVAPLMLTAPVRLVPGLLGAFKRWK